MNVTVNVEESLDRFNINGNVCDGEWIHDVLVSEYSPDLNLLEEWNEFLDVVVVSWNKTLPSLELPEERLKVTAGGES